MLAVIVPVTSWSSYQALALPGLERVMRAAPETLLCPRTSTASYQDTVNLLLDEVSHLEGLEGAVVLHQDVELLDGDLPRLLRAAFADERVAIVGAIGSTRRDGLNWGVGNARGGTVELPDGHPPLEIRSGYAIVAAVDGICLGLSPWSVRNLRFDSGFADSFHGYDMDLCLQARAHGRLVVADNIHLRHHTLDGLRGSRARAWIDAEVMIRRKWDVPLAQPGLAWARGPMR